MTPSCVPCCRDAFHFSKHYFHALAVSMSGRLAQNLPSSTAFPLEAMEIPQIHWTPIPCCQVQGHREQHDRVKIQSSHYPWTDTSEELSIFLHSWKPTCFKEILDTSLATITNQFLTALFPAPFVLPQTCIKILYCCLQVCSSFPKLWQSKC